MRSRGGYVVPAARVYRDVFQPARPGWSRRYSKPLEWLKALLTGLLYLGCLAEIVVALFLASFFLNGPRP